MNNFADRVSFIWSVADQLSGPYKPAQYKNLMLPLADPELRQAATANNLDNFRYVFVKALHGLFIDRMEQIEDIFARYMNDGEFKLVVSEYLLKQVYDQIREEGAA